MKYSKNLRKLEARIVDYEKNIVNNPKIDQKSGYRKPGSQNRHKN